MKWRVKITYKYLFFNFNLIFAILFFTGGEVRTGFCDEAGIRMETIADDENDEGWG